MSKRLCFLQYHTPSDEIRGKTRRYLYEVCPNVFTGVISKRVREQLWELIESSNTEAVLIHAADNEQGFSYKSTYKEEPFLNLDGISLPYKALEEPVIPYAKPNKKLTDHLLETGTIAEALLSKGRAAHCLEILSERFPVSKEDMMNLICFLCAAHDIGKAHPGFLKHMALNCDPVSQCYHAYELMNNKGLICDNDAKIRHERYSSEIITQYLTAKNIDAELAKNLSMVTAFHHQGKPGSVNEKTACYKAQEERWNTWKNIQNEILDRLYERWPVSEAVNDLIDQLYVNGLSFILLSIMVCCDWISSNDAWECCVKNAPSLEAAAESFIDKNMLKQQHIKEILKDVRWEDICKYPKNELQKIVSSLEESYCELMIIEAPCGYGKTLTSLLAAKKLGAYLSGIFFATPTMSTARSLALDLRKFIKNAKLDLLLPELDSSMIWSTDEMAKIPKELWCSRSRHQLLYPSAVGTIDQVLKSVINYRYSCIGLVGVADKTVIIDEVHAYDEYMITELETLIRYCRFLKVPVILLSATLPKRTKLRLYKAAGLTKDIEIDDAYPLISYVQGKKLTQIPVEIEGRTFAVQSKQCDVQEELYQYGIKHKDGVMALITATVDNAFELYHRLKADVKDAEVILYQGRDTVNHKAGKVEKLLNCLGSEKNIRPKKMIIVATGIIEQSLNIDVDIMITEIAPIDLLIQRMGRVWRFDDTGTVRETKTINVPFIVLYPKKYGDLSRIYNATILQNTQKVIEGISKIDTVKDIRLLIDQVYDNAPREFSSETRAAFQCFPDPAKDEFTLDAGLYRQFDLQVPMTREERYPTAQIVILPELKLDYTYKEMQDIMQNNVINVAENRLKPFVSSLIPCNIKWLENMYVFVSDDLNVHGSGKTMALTEDGLEFYDESIK